MTVYSTAQTPLKFDASSYTADISENIERGTEVFTVTANGPTGWRGSVYLIVGGNIDNAFGIDISTGKVTVSKKLDYENIKEYKLAIRVVMKSPSNDIPDVANEIMGIVTIKDVNDNLPKFAASNPTKVAVEDHTPKDTTVMQVRL